MMSFGTWYAYLWAQDLWSTVFHARARKMGYILAWRWCFMRWIQEFKNHLRSVW